MPNEFNGIEKRLNELNDRLARLEPLKTKPRIEFDTDPYLRDVVERNLEIAAQCVIDICNRLIALENARKPGDYYEAIAIMGELGILPVDVAYRLALIAGFRNILIHEYISIDWDLVYKHLQNINELTVFADYIQQWLSRK